MREASASFFLFNIYMCMISLKRLIIEGRYDSIVTALSREMLNAIKSSFESTKTKNGKFAGTKIYFRKGEQVPTIHGDDFDHIYFHEVENEQIPLEFKIALRVQWIEGLDDYRKGGDAYNDQTDDPADATTDPYIEIRFELDPADAPNIYSKVAMDLRDTIRHEIEHITQTGWNLLPGKYLPNDQERRKQIETGELPAREYFLLPMEIPAMIQGMYLQAKKSRQPFSKIVNDYLDRFIAMKDENGNSYITPEDKEQILATWRKHVPKLGLKVKL